MFYILGSGRRNSLRLRNKYSSIWNGLNRPRPSCPVRSFDLALYSPRLSTTSSCILASVTGTDFVRCRPSRILSVLFIILSLLSVFTFGSNIQPTSSSPANTIRVQEGDSVLFPCSLGDNFRYSLLSWSLDGRPLVTRQVTYTASLPGGRGSLRPDDSLLIASVRVEDSGAYTCVGIEGKRSRDVTHLLVVEVGKPIMQHADTNLVLTGGSTLSLKCSGLFPLEWEYPWQGEKNLQITSQLKPPVNGSLTMSPWRENSVLTVVNITVHDSGEYRCSHRGTYDRAEEKWAATRVFVMHEKSKTFLPHLDEPITVFPGLLFVIPCRSFPNQTSKIKLRPVENFWNNREERSDRRTYLDNLTYTHHEGFSVDEYKLWFGHRMKCFLDVPDEGGEETLFFNLTVVDSPTMNVDTDIMRTEGASLELTCSGLLRILWSFPVMEGARTPRISSTVDSSTGRVESVLRLESVSSSHSGKYSCFYSEYRAGLSEELQTSTYVFVTNDHGEDFLPVSYEEETIHIAKDVQDSFIIPCCVNNPNTTVKLALCYKYQQECPDTLLSGYNKSYEPKTGFRLVRKDTSRDPTRINLRARCSTEQDAQVFDLFFEGGEDNGLNVAVAPSSEKVFTNREELNITCRVDILKFLLLDPTLRPQIVWEFPTSENLTYVIDEDEDSSPDEQFLYYSQLTIFNVTSSTGFLTFTCLASNSMFRNQDSTAVQVYDEAFIDILNLDEQNLTRHQPLEGDQICLSVTVSSFPAMIVEWYREGEIVNASYEYNITDTEGRYTRNCSLCFIASYWSTGGGYLLNVDNGFIDENATFSIDVLVPPSIKIDVDGYTITPYEGASPLYEAMLSYTFDCTVDGNPTALVHWEYSECTSLATDNDRCQPEGRETKPFSKDRGDYPWYIFSDGSPEPRFKELQVGAQTSAIFKCVAVVNSTRFEEPAVSESVRFLVLAEKEAFHFTVTEDVFVEQKAQMDCFVNGFSYRETMIGFRVNGSNEIIPVDHTQNSRMTETHFLHDNFRKRTVKIYPLRLEDSGTYYCVATPENEGVEKQIKEIQLVVKDITPVEIHCTADNITHDINGDDFVVSCLITGAPQPRAAWRFPSQPSLNQPFDWVPINMTAIRTNLTIPVSYVAVGERREVIVDGIIFKGTTSATIILDGVASPIIQDAEAVTLDKMEVGQNFSFGCYAEGSPEPLIGWKKRTPSNTVSQIESSRITILDGVFSVYHAEEKDSGVYICTASNEYGYSEKLYNISITPVDPKEEGFPTIYIIFISLTVVVSFLAVFVCISQRGNPKEKHLQFTLSELNELNRGGPYPLHMQGMMPEEIYERLPYDPRWEFNRERLLMGPVIGRGAFGMVIKAKAVGIEDPNRSSIVAVKTLKDETSDTEKKALWAELKLLAHVGRHLNVVNFLGACTTGAPLLLIVEFCRHGNLSEYLRKRRRVFYGSRDNTGSDSSQMSTTASFPNLSNESQLRTVREHHDESINSYNQSSTGGTCDSAIGHSTTDSPLFNKSGVTFSTAPTDSPSLVRLKSRSSIDLTNCGSLPTRKRSDKSNDSGGGQDRDAKRSQMIAASSMGSLNRNALNQAKRSTSPLSNHNPLIFDDSFTSAFELPLREEDLICFSFQTARGMEFLSSKQVIHRDLAARNVLLTDSNVVKICDFGLARHLYHNPDYIASGKGRFPVKWMAPESIFDKVYTTQTDIWSFGVLLWEIFSLGGSPYPGLQMDENFYAKLKDGYRMSPPEIAPPGMGEIMHECWNEDPKDRPPFSELENRLGDLLAANTRTEYVEMNNPYEDMTAELEAQQQEHLKETSILLPARSFESLCEPPATPSDTESGTEDNSLEPPSLSDLHQTTIV